MLNLSHSLREYAREVLPLSNSFNLRKEAISSVSDVKEMQKFLPDMTNEQISDLLVDRSEGDSKLITLGLHHVVTNKEAYIFCEAGVVPAQSGFAIDLENEVVSPVTPPHVSIKAIWDTTPTISGKGKNLFGDNGSLYIDEERLSIPCVEATAETLAYYGAVLIKPGEAFRFPDERFCLWHMYAGKNHVRDYLLTAEGHGFWLETHPDQPHINFPLKDGDGVYPLARWSDENKENLQITAFTIPPGHGLYVKKGSIHSGSCLSGHFIEGYMTPEVSSTVHMQVSKSHPVTVQVTFE